MTEKFLAVRCPFTQQDRLPFPNLGFGHEKPWYGIVPETADTKNLIIWYFSFNEVVVRGMSRILEVLVVPKGVRYFNIEDRCENIVRQYIKIGHIKEVEKWYFLRFPKDYERLFL